MKKPAVIDMKVKRRVLPKPLRRFGKESKKN
jgi:hypothetical protein